MQGMLGLSRPLAMRPQSQPFGAAARQQQAAVRRVSLVVRADNEPRVTKEYREGEDSVRMPGAQQQAGEPAANPNSQYVDDLAEVGRGGWVAAVASPRPAAAQLRVPVKPRDVCVAGGGGCLRRLVCMFFRAAAAAGAV